MLFGSIGLFAYWIMVCAKKATRLHVKLGTIFAYSMYLLGLTSFALGAAVIMDPLAVHPERNPKTATEFAGLFFFLGALQLLTTWNAVRCIQARRSLGHPGQLDFCFNGIVFIGGLLGVGIGIETRNYLIGLFGCLAIFKSVTHLRFMWSMRSGLVSQAGYLRQHIVGTIDAGVALHIAFFAGGASFRFFPWLGQHTSFLFWIVTVRVIGSFVQSRVMRKYALAAR